MVHHPANPYEIVTMEKTIIWKGIEYHSLEHCTVGIENGALVVNSTIVGHYSENRYSVTYNLKTNARGETTNLSINANLNGNYQVNELIKLQDGVWQMNGNTIGEFTGCTDVDIALTPLTNTFPIRRLKLQPGEDREIRVIYFDLLEGVVKSLSQKYKCLKPAIYHYENIPNDFEADITVDEHGLVIDYPQLFTRVATT